MKYRKKPLIVDAFRYGIDSNPEWFQPSNKKLVYEVMTGSNQNVHFINTMESIISHSPGDWMVRDVDGRINSYTPDSFEMAFEPVTEGEE